MSKERGKVEIKNEKLVESDQNPSSRLVAFDNAIQSYVEALFGVKKLSNALAHSFIEFYTKDKQLFMDSIKPLVEKANEDFCQRVSKVIEKKNIESNLKKMDEAVIRYNSSLFSGKPVNDVRKKMFAMKKAFLENNKKVIEEEFEKLTNDLDEEMGKYDTQNKQLSVLLKEKDSEIELYKEKICQVDDVLEDCRQEVLIQI